MRGCHVRSQFCYVGMWMIAVYKFPSTVVSETCCWSLCSTVPCYQHTSRVISVIPQTAGEGIIRVGNFLIHELLVALKGTLHHERYLRFFPNSPPPILDKNLLFYASVTSDAEGNSVWGRCQLEQDFPWSYVLIVDFSIGDWEPALLRKYHELWMLGCKMIEEFF